MRNKKIMILLIISLTNLLICSSIIAQSPQKMSYQAVIRNSSDQLVINHSVGMRISILQGSETGTAVYVESQTPTSNLNGLVTIEIGGGTPVTGTFAGINWSTGTYFIKTETDPSGGTTYSITGISQILSVPYALYAKSSESSIDAVKLTGNQTISGNKSFSGTTTVVTPVNATDAVNKEYVDILKSLIDGLQVQIGINDIDGNQYNVVKIGIQLWMKENLRTTKYRNGDLIGSTYPTITDISSESSPKYQWSYNDAISELDIYINQLIMAGGGGYTFSQLVGLGTITAPQRIQFETWVGALGVANSDTKTVSAISVELSGISATLSDKSGFLYTWYAITDSRNVCPAGWHVATDNDWNNLGSYLGGLNIAGGKLKEEGLSHWLTPNNGATNSSGFTALPAGSRQANSFGYSGTGAYFWSPGELNTDLGLHWRLSNINAELQQSTGHKYQGYSVRCIKD